MDGWMDWLRGRLFSFPEDPVNRKPPSVRAAAGQVRAAAGQPTQQPRSIWRLCLKMWKLGARSTPKMGGYSSLLSRAVGPPGPVLLGSTRRSGNLGPGGPFSPSWEAQSTGASHHHTVRLGPGLSEQRVRDRLSRQGWEWGVLVAGHKDL